MIKDRAGFAQVSSFVTQRPSRQASSSNRKSRRILVKEDVTSKSHSDLDNGEDGDDDGCYHLLIYRAPAISQGPNGHRPVSRRALKHPSGPVKFSVLLAGKGPLSPGFPGKLPLGKESFHTPASLTPESVEGPFLTLHAI